MAFLGYVLGCVELDRESDGSIEIGPPDAGFGGPQPTPDGKAPAAMPTPPAAIDAHPVAARAAVATIRWKCRGPGIASSLLERLKGDNRTVEVIVDAAEERRFRDFVSARSPR
ncbi:hypothetical protein [Nonomuraea recticatena]|uniref:hypothetical protein n=1 Tax=Nonomuraea recticatena TaxID=46178 RepID=UPI0036195169